MKKFAATFVLAAMIVIPSISAQKARKTDSNTFEAVKKLVGGSWRGTVGKMPVVQTYHLNEIGNAIIGEGTVGDPGKPILRIKTTMGIDAVSGKVYYLDEHNGDTVYFGWCTLDANGTLSMDFKVLAGGEGHWVSESRYTNSNQLDSVLFEFKSDGNKAEVHKMTLKRE